MTGTATANRGPARRHPRGAVGRGSGAARRDQSPRSRRCRQPSSPGSVLPSSLVRQHAGGAVAPGRAPRTPRAGAGASSLMSPDALNPRRARAVGELPPAERRAEQGAVQPRLHRRSVGAPTWMRGGGATPAITNGSGSRAASDHRLTLGQDDPAAVVVRTTSGTRRLIQNAALCAGAVDDRLASAGDRDRCAGEVVVPLCRLHTHFPRICSIDTWSPVASLKKPAAEFSGREFAKQCSQNQWEAMKIDRADAPAPAVAHCH
jgi:hypothetical protein